MQAKQDFYYSEANQPHPMRAKAMLQKYPNIKELYGAEPRTLLVILLIVLFQTALASFLGIAGFAKAWWAALILAYVVGAFFNHATFVIIHEACHNLILGPKILNRFAGCLVDLVNIFPSSEGFKVYHLRHHAHQGDYEFDADIPYYKEARIVKNNFFFKVLWLLFFPIVQALRPLRLKKINMWNPWIFVNLAFNLLYAIFLIKAFGINAVFYLFMSFVFSIGLHPLGARWIQEHYTPEGNPQESFNYSGSLNYPSLNVGYHNEHHDFPYVSWYKLPMLREIAPEYYQTLVHHTSWFKLFFEFLTQDRYDLFSRIIRKKEGKFGVDDDFENRNELVLAKELEG
jgi:sphingolipid delta-4 desaturase